MFQDDPRGKFKFKTFIPVMDALESNLAQGQATQCAMKLQIQFDLKFSALCRAYHADVDVNPVGEGKHFYQYIRHTEAFRIKM